MNVRPFRKSMLGRNCLDPASHFRRVEWGDVQAESDLQGLARSYANFATRWSKRRGGGENVVKAGRQISAEGSVIPDPYDEVRLNPMLSLRPTLLPAESQWINTICG
jgi:hypothetical protein